MSTILEDEHAAVISVDTDEQLFDYLADSHCHLQDDMETVSHLNSMRVRHVAVMAERRSDWQNVERIHELYSGKGQLCSCVFTLSLHAYLTLIFREAFTEILVGHCHRCLKGS
jgi:hypothetical protein